MNLQDSELISLGLDLAWSARNNTGFAALRWDGRQAALTEAQIVVSDDEILAAVARLAGDAQSVVIAVDAPLIVPNQEGRRPGDAEIQRVFGRFDAGAYPANRRWLATHQGEVRGEVIARRLGEELRIRHRATIEPRQPTRQVFEAFPHPAMITLFRLAQTLKYKVKPKRTLETRLAAFREYQRLMHEKLSSAEPRLVIDATLMEFLDERQLMVKTLAALKQYEDRLDAVMCAYIGLYYWYWGEERCRIFGNEAEGYIVAPVDERTQTL